MLLSGGAQGYASPAFSLQALLLALVCLAFGVWLVSSVRRARRQHCARGSRDLRVAPCPRATARRRGDPSACRVASVASDLGDSNAPAVPPTTAGACNGA